MRYMFWGCNDLETIYASKGWTTDSVTSSYAMFYGCTSLVGEQGTVYDESHVDAAYAHIDEGLSKPGYLSRKREAYAVLTAGEILTFYYDDERSIRQGSTYLMNTGITNPRWSDQAKSITQVLLDSTFVDARPTSTYGWFFQMDKIKSITGITYLNTDSVTDMRRMFAGCKLLKSVDLSNFNTENVTNMWAMFYDCDSLISLDLSGFDMSKVTNMARMFSDCDTLTFVNLNGFRTDSVKDMAGMFAGCRSLKSLDLSGFNSTNVKYMGYMFDGCKSLISIDLDGFNTSSATEMEYMFQDCDALASLNLRGFNTSSVNDMGGMFAGCDTLATLDLSSFNTENVRIMEAMFNGCKHLQTIYAGDDWSTEAVTESRNMFNGCTKLVGGRGTVYDKNHVDASRAHIDEGPTNPGYLTGKTDPLLQGDVNADGEVNIADVNCVISVILGDPDIYEGRADVNGDGELNIADINAVLDHIL
jgi:surface protein